MRIPGQSFPVFFKHTIAFQTRNHSPIYKDIKNFQLFELYPLLKHYVPNFDEFNFYIKNILEKISIHYRL